ncbi:bacitracin resistance protein BacA [Helicobacter valdiviensis]|uniref:Bacitracin resistance protein BacA n=1 Tax=Helicobacter valdiviensis TaxID=1458358 RepID=A0A2W6NN72_9HELI|nr:globin domain-containing protein [Helicobacter valdiviensis]PZT48886.1 bacitracin resistance protein BacA [Helicobacter valdiviensis]
MLDNQTIEIIKSTVPALKTYGEDITKVFYRELFGRYPQVQDMFDMEKQKNGKQPKALALAVLNAAMNIENLENIRKSVEKIGKTHVELNVKKEHYPLVGECLLVAIQEVLGEAASPEVIEAWGKAYGAIADFYIAIEEKMYQAQ